MGSMSSGMLKGALASRVAVVAISAAAAGVCAFAPSLTERLPAAAALALGVSSLAIWQMRRHAAIADAARDVGTVAREAAEREAIAKAQDRLEENLNALRDLCYGHGDPRLVDGALWFGDYAVAGRAEIVDQVQDRHGGAATIFQGPKRVATNVKDQNGARMVGTTLDQGPVYEALFRQGKTFRGEAQIAGVPYITIYEPIVSGADVVGAIFVAVKRADTVHAGAADAPIPKPVAAIRSATAELRALLRERDEMMRVAALQRSEMTDRRRKQKALERASAMAQHAVVAALSNALDRLARADLTSSIEVAFPESYQKVKDDFAATVDALRQALGAIKAETRNIRAGSIEITSAVDDLSRRTEQQAANLEETAASLDQITQAVRQTAGSVEEARRIAAQASTAAESSSLVMRDAVSTMSEIDRSSKKIGQIIGVINEIALQTNLLALNAGVEAARAGEGGRGFAVVAAEVRALAQRSAEAAVEIRTLIEESAQHVGKGVDLIGETGTALQGITGHVRSIGEIIAGISSSAKDQALSLQEINTAVMQMDKFTQQNAAMVEESTAASQVLAQQAEMLDALVGQFKMGDAANDLAVARARLHNRAA